jgi:ssRNA-specific RNase YbeY (16S rRNA maturation enzyme)
MLIGKDFESRRAGCLLPSDYHHAGDYVLSISGVARQYDARGRHIFRHVSHIPYKQ